MLTAPLPSGHRCSPNIWIKFSWIQLSYTTLFVGAPGIEPGSHAPKACILPIYYAPTKRTEIIVSKKI